MSMCRPKNPIIAVIGATGTGKSQLAVDLALRFNGEIINCDAVQMYKGLPIITNKITEREKKGITHHLLDCIPLDEPTWTVGKFVPEALRISKEIQSRGKIPVLAGGTHYYIQSFLYQNSLVQAKHDTYDLDHDHTQYPILNEPTSVILEKLRDVDPLIAQRWHPDDRRKIQRSLEIWLKTGTRASDHYAAQQQNVDSNNPLFDALIFWVYAEKKALDPRLHNRVLKMVDSGLLDEVMQLSQLQSQLGEEGRHPDLTRGIWISIGFKEFSAYIRGHKAHASKEELEKLKDQAVERVQISTHQYAKTQLRWIRNKFLSASQRSASSHLYLLDGSDLNTWQNSVADEAVDIAQRFLQGESLPDPTEVAAQYADELVPKGQDLSRSCTKWQKRACELCKVVAISPEDWEKHITSNRHKKVVASRRKREQLALRQTLIEHPIPP